METKIDMDKNCFRYTMEKYNVDKDKWFENQATFTLEEIPIKVPIWLTDNYCNYKQIKCIDQSTGIMDIDNIPIFERDTVSKINYQFLQPDSYIQFIGKVQFIKGEFCVVSKKSNKKYPIKDSEWRIINE